MKTRSMKFWTCLALAWATGWVAVAQQQRLCATPWTVGPCPITWEFVRPVDLDGDGVADFTHERFQAHSRFDAVDGSGEFYQQDDTIEALYPAGHVEVYWLIWGPTFGDPVPRLSAGQELVMEPEVVRPGPDGLVPRRYGSWGLPEPARSYVYPYYFEPWGLGVIFRRAQWSCELKGSPFTCGRTYYTGYVPPWEDWPSDRTEEVTDQYFGFRLRREDGWHLGWLRLRWHWVFGGVTPDPIELVDWAVHPLSLIHI